MPNGERALTDLEHQYLRDIMRRFIVQIRAGHWTQEEAENYLMYAYGRILDEGIHPGTPYYKEVKAWRELEARHIAAGPPAGSLLDVSSKFEEAIRPILAQDIPYEEKLGKLENLYRQTAYAYPEFRRWKLGTWDPSRILTGLVEQSLSPARKGELASRRFLEVGAQAGPTAQQLAELQRQQREAQRGKLIRETKFGIPIEETRVGLPGPEPYKEWFEARFSTLVRRFQVAPIEEVEKGWAEYIKKEEPKLREEWWTMRPFERGEFPSRYAPPVRTVQF